ncbi:MAG: hypothetical protein ACRDL0_03050, partial [Thermoleophilaceae bacterium]
RGLPGRLDEFAERIAPLPEGVPSAVSWGSEAIANGRLAPLLSELELRARSVALRFDDPDACFTALARPLGLDAAGLAELRPDFDRLLASCDNGIGEVRIGARYLIALGRR